MNRTGTFVWLIVLLILGFIAGTIAYVIISPELKYEEDLAKRLSSEVTDDVIEKPKVVVEQPIQEIKTKEDIAEISDSELVSIEAYSEIQVENYYQNNPLRIDNPEKGKPPILKIVGKGEVKIKAGTLKKLIHADKILKEEGYKIVVFCAYRDENLQTFLRQHYVNTTGDPNGFNYVASPGSSWHQTGQAVDMTIAKSDGTRNDPTPYLLLKEGASVKNNLDNPYVPIMQKAMTDVGFALYASEWWHFTDKTEY